MGRRKLEYDGRVREWVFLVSFPMEENGVIAKWERAMEERSGKGVACMSSAIAQVWTTPNHPLHPSRTNLEAIVETGRTQTLHAGCAS